MNINGTIYITKGHNNDITTNIFLGTEYANNHPEFNKTVFQKGDYGYDALLKILSCLYKRGVEIDRMNIGLSRLYQIMGYFTSEEIEDRLMTSDSNKVGISATDSTDNTTTNTVDINQLKRLVANIKSFFSEFSAETSIRMINTMAFMTKERDIKDYVASYYRLQDHPIADNIIEKTKSQEFSAICNGLINITPSKRVNTRLSIYYGEPGTGKTTLAMKGDDNTTRTVIVCRSDMLPADIMEDFDFVDGKATFKKSAFWKAMENGETIVLDEINLLPLETTRFLQGLLDGKPSITYKGVDININEYFSVIGTMNLAVNGEVRALPSPLVDRANELREFKATDEFLIEALM